MTPQEKAIELVHKFLRCKDYSDSYYVIPIQEDATRCAIIAVDEILDLNLALSNCDENNWDIDKFYLEVKQEIEKL